MVKHFRIQRSEQSGWAAPPSSACLRLRQRAGVSGSPLWSWRTTTRRDSAADTPRGTCYTHPGVQVLLWEGMVSALKVQYFLLEVQYLNPHPQRGGGYIRLLQAQHRPA